MLCGGRPVGYLGGYTQERIQNGVDLRAGVTILVDSGWTAPYATNNPRFHVDGQQILDLKRYSGGAAFANRPVGRMRKVTQSIRLVFKEPCGNLIECPLSPSFTVYTVKDANGTTYHDEHE